MTAHAMFLFYMDHQREDIASIGLKSPCRIVLDMLEVDADDQGPVMPIYCLYSIRDTRRRMQERKQGFLDEERRAHCVDVLLRMSSIIVPQELELTARIGNTNDWGGPGC